MMMIQDYSDCVHVHGVTAERREGGMLYCSIAGGGDDLWAIPIGSIEPTSAVWKPAQKGTLIIARSLAVTLGLVREHYSGCWPGKVQIAYEDDKNQQATQTRIEIVTTANEIRDFLLEKNTNYGDSALNPVRIFSRADSLEQLRVRIDDKLSRLARGDEACDDEDVLKDLIGYLILLLIGQRRQ